MKSKNLSTDVKFRKPHVRAFSFLIVLLMLVPSLFAQVQPDKLRTVPTDMDDETSVFLVASHLTDTLCGHPSFDPAVHCVDSNENGRAGIQVTQGGDWFEYQIVATKTSDYAVVIGIGCDAPAARANVGVYKTEGGEFVMSEESTSIFTDEWHVETPFTFPLGTLEAGVVHTMRISWLESGSNIFSVKVIETVGSTDATLSALLVNGDTVPNFDPAVTTYNIGLPPYAGVESIEATVNDENASVVVPEIGDLVDAKTPVVLTVTSESGITQDYTVNLFQPMEVGDGVEFAMGQFWVNSGTNCSDTRINNLNNGDYIDYYVYSQYDANYIITLENANGYTDSESYLNMSVRHPDSAWVLNDFYTQYIPITLDELGVGTWGSNGDVNNQNVSFLVSLKADEPMLMRLQSITNKGNAANIYSFTVEETLESIDATLKDLKVDGVTVPGFDPEVTTYNIAMSTGASAAIIEAEANSSDAISVEGLGAVDLIGFVSTDTVTVTSESGFSMNYILNFYTPVELSDNLSLLMGDQLFTNYGVSASNTTINWFANEEYIEYYVYSGADEDYYLTLSGTNGNPDTVISEVNVSTYPLGGEWSYNEANSIFMPRTEADMWTVDYATDIDFNLSFIGGQPTLVTIYAKSNAGNTFANIYSLSFHVGQSDYVALESVETSNVQVFSGNGNLTVLCDEAYVGGSVQIYDLTGRLVKDAMIESNRTVYNMDRSGLYIVKLLSTNKAVSTAKCFVR